MQTLSEPVSDRSDPFGPTQWSVVLAAGRSQIDPEIAHAALAQLCQTYWPPLYAFVRSRGYSLHDAQDLTQSFFEHLIEHKIYGRADRQKGRFRSFLLASLKNFLANAHDREQTLKRGGGQNFLPLHEQQAKEAEFLFQTHGASNNEIATDRLFERSWADTLVNAVLAELSAAYQAEGKDSLFEEFRTFLTVGESLPSYEQLASRLHVPASTLRSHVTRLRAHYRKALRAEVRRTVESEAEVDGELRELLRVLTTG